MGLSQLVSTDGDYYSQIIRIVFYLFLVQSTNPRRRVLIARNANSLLLTISPKYMAIYNIH